MSYIKIQKIKKEDIETPEKGYVYFGYDDLTVDGTSHGFWIKDDDGTAAQYIVGQNDAKPTIVQLPVIPPNNGDTISIYGTNFVPNNTIVTFSGTSGIDVKVLTSNLLTIVVPNVNGDVPVVIATAFGYSDPANLTVIHKNIKPVITPPIVPTSASIGSYVTINGYNFIAGTEVIFGGDPATTIIVNSTQLSVVVPETITGTTQVFATNSNGSSNAVDFYVTDTNPKFYNFFPSWGVIGDTISISGANFANGQIQVRFGNIQASDITFHTSTYLTAKIASETPFGDTFIRVHNIALSGFTVSGSSIGLLPTISNISPPNEINGSTLTVTGTNLNGTITITFSGIPVTILSNSSTSATIYLNNIVPGVNSVKVINQYGESLSYSYNVAGTIGGPIITTFNPISEFRGRSVRIYGNNFVSGAGNTVYYGGTKVLVSSNATATSVLTELTPKNPITTIPTGVINVKLVNNNGACTMSGFTVKTSGDTPNILYISPIYAKTGDLIDIYGTNLYDGIASFGYSYPGLSNTTTMINNSHLQVNVPSGLVNAGENKLINVYVTTLTGTCSYAPIEIYALPYNDPDILNFEPKSGSTGTLVTISGTSFTKYWTDASIYIGGSYYILDSQTFISNNEIRGYIPNTNGNYGSATIRVITPVGTDQKATFTILADCVLQGTIDCNV